MSYRKSGRWLPDSHRKPHVETRAFGYRILAAKIWVRSKDTIRWIRGAEGGTWTWFLEVLRLPPGIHHFTNDSYSFIIVRKMGVQPIQGHGLRQTYLSPCKNETVEGNNNNHHHQLNLTFCELLTPKECSSFVSPQEVSYIYYNSLTQTQFLWLPTYDVYDTLLLLLPDSCIKIYL
jgi:hypothetical protein